MYIQLSSIHGLLRGHDLEMGRDADTGGQLKYVTELLRALSRIPDVRKVDLFTRLIADKRYAADYAEPVERINKKARIVRIQCGGRKYLRKERLWPHLDEYVDKTLRFIKQENDIPDVVHGHYADAGYAASELSALLGIPFVFTGHSLGVPKKARLANDGLSEAEINRRFRIDHRIAVEGEVLGRADAVVASTHQEVEEQYRRYTTGCPECFHVIPPGIDVERFRAYYDDDENIVDVPERERVKQAAFHMEKELERFLREPRKPLILALSRPDR
ncbi:MAG: glycosyltransferase, partial [Lentisphaerae bacterium]|nr:glycosyltransferase [Lentisphaerota bacterium]